MKYADGDLARREIAPVLGDDPQGSGSTHGSRALLQTANPVCFEVGFVVDAASIPINVEIPGSARRFPLEPNAVLVISNKYLKPNVVWVWPKSLRKSLPQWVPGDLDQVQKCWLLSPPDFPTPFMGLAISRLMYK